MPEIHYGYIVAYYEFLVRNFVINAPMNKESIINALSINSPSNTKAKTLTLIIDITPITNNPMSVTLLISFASFPIHHYTMTQIGLVVMVSLVSHQQYYV